LPKKNVENNYIILLKLVDIQKKTCDKYQIKFYIKREDLSNSFVN